MGTTTISITEMTGLVENIASLNLGYLSIAVTILLFLGGAFYLFNFKPLKDRLEQQEKTLSDLEKEVKENLSSSKQEIKKDLEIFKKEQDKNSLNFSRQRDEKLLADIKTKIVRFEKEFTQKFDSFVEEKDTNLKTIILAEVSNEVRELEKTLSTKIESSRSESEEKIVVIKKSLTSILDALKEVKRITRELEVLSIRRRGKWAQFMDLLIYYRMQLMKIVGA